MTQRRQGSSLKRIVVAVTLVLVALMVTDAFGTAARAADLDPDAPYLLTMPDLASPRATIEALRANGEILAQHLASQEIGWVQPPALRRMMATIDTSELPPAHVLLTTGLAAIHLKFVLDRLPAEQLADAPDAAAVARDKITQWRVPGTPIVIAKAAAGPQAGQFLFSPQTVALSGSLYDAAKQLPQPLGPAAQAIDAWIIAPGPLLPRAMIAALPAPLRMPLYGQAVWQWIGLAVLQAVSIAAMLRLVVWGIGHDAREARAVRRFGQLAAAAMVVGISSADAALAFFALKIWGDTLGIVVVAMKTLAVGGAAWFVVMVAQRLGGLAVQTRDAAGPSVDRQLIKVICTLLSIVTVIVAGFVIADLFGIPVGPLLAGLGIGGLAIALAIRATLENVIGGLTLFADRPIRVGEFCRFGNEAGTVEEIGLRTTKIRRLDDTLTTIPNAELAQIQIENVSRRRKYLFNPTLGLRYETTAEQLKQIETGILQVLAEHPKVLDDGPRVRFANFGDYALNLDVFAYVDVTQMPAFVAVQEELNLLIMDVVKRAGTGFAFPSQTNYLSKDTMPNADG